MNILLCRIKKYLAVTFLLLLTFACSTEKNTPLSVAFHNMTAHYNIQFNGSESYLKGLRKIEDAHEDNYTEILPVYIVPDENAAGTVAPDMERTQKKAMKVIELHSIKVKREYKKGDLTQKQRDYLKKNEYNKWVDDAYMLIGQTYFYQRNYSLSLETFRFVLREFENEPVTVEAKLWMAKANIEEQEFGEALNILNDIDTRRKVDEKVKSQINAVFAQYFIYQNEYENAIKRLKKALKKPGGKTNKMRYTFILAQLYQKTGNNGKAYNMYEKVIKMNPPYEMTFNAKINMAGTFEKGNESGDDILSQLYKMLKDDKNLDFRDQIYYAIGDIYLKEGDKTNAIENYKFSAGYSVDNNRQKARTYIALADLYYEQPSYIDAQAYYDSAFTIIDTDYKDYDIIEAKSKNLNELVESIKAVKLQDSLQYLASLSIDDRMNVIDEIIAGVEAKEREEQLAEQQRLQDMQLNQINNLNNTAANRTNAWYFYNPTAKSYGQKEFRTTWGQRKLEDNWRRKNKKISVHDQLAYGEGNTKTEEKDKELNNKSREYYMQNIPLTDSAMEASNEIIKEALVNIGLIYRNQFNETELSIEAFLDLIRRYPNDNITLNAYYNLYLIYKESDPAKSNMYKNTIINRFPNSNFAKVLTDPNYFKEIEKQEKESQVFYEKTFNLFKQERYNEVINNANYALNRYKDVDLIPKFKYLRTLSIGKTSDAGSFRKALNEFINEPENGDLIKSANKILSYLDNQNPEVKNEQETEIAYDLYSTELEKEYFLIISLPIRENLNQLAFNIINFNLDNFDKQNLSVNQVDFDGNLKLVKIDMFKDLDAAMKYYNTISSDQSVFKEVNANEANIFVISAGNYNTLIKDKTLSRYLIFFENNF